MADENWQQIKEIFNAALLQKPEDRRKFLDRACDGDAALHEEVQSLLSSFNDAAESFMETIAAKEVAEEIIAGKNFEKGKSFGHYEIVRQIGSGGMGDVYLAKDTRLDRPVAVKILNEKYSLHKSNLNRFIREAKSVSALNHPNILVIHEIGESENVHYIVSEYISGKTLREILGEKTLQIAEILDISIQIVSAVAAAHEAHLVHRDIKPENIMIRPDGYAKILDFGLAKLVRQKAFEPENTNVKQNQTAKGVILGTVNYMSPEQAKGQKVDGRTDIFSFGIVIYEMLTGKTPFAGDSVSETFANLINKEPAPLSRLIADASNELEKIVAKTLKKNTDERYQTMQDLLADLKSLRKRIEFESEFELKNSLETDAETEESKSGNADFSPPQTVNSIAVLPFANLSADTENEYFCDGLAEELMSALVKIEDLKVAARTSAFSFKNKNAEVSEIGKILNVRTVLEGSVRKSGNRLRINIQLVNASDGFHLWSERFDGEMRDIFDLQDEIVLAVINKLKVKFLSEEKAAVLKRYTENPKAYEYYLKGMYYRWKFSPEDFRRSGDYFHRAVDADPTFALGYFGLNSYYGYGTAWGLLNIPPAEGWAKAEAAINKGLEIDPTLPELQLSSAALTLINYRNFDEAGKKIERAAANSKFPEIHHVYSYYLLLTGRFDEAIAEAEYALQLDPLSVNYSSSLGRWLFFTRRYDEAVAQLKKSLELDPNNASVHEFLGDVYREQGKFDVAIAEWHRAMTLEGDDELAAILKNSYAENNFASAVHSVARKRIERLKANVESGEFVLAIHFARAYLMLDDKEKAFEWLEKVVEERNVFPLLINVDPLYDRLRGDSRFHQLVKRIGIPVNQTDHSENAAEPTGENEFLDKTASENPANKNSTSENLTRTSSMTGSFNNRKRFYVFGLIFLFAAVGFGYYYWFFAGKTPVEKKTLAVLPFVNADQNSNTEYLSDGITESIINNLSQISELKVMSRNSAFRLKGNQVDTRAIASQLGAETLVTGDIKQVEDKLVINVRLINAADDSQIWGNQYVRATNNIFAVQNEIAQAVAGNLRVILTETERQQLNKKPTENLEAYQLYLRGRAKTTPPDTSQAINYFQQAIDIDPNYALAYAGLASAYRTLVLAGDAPPREMMPQAKAAALRAVELDDREAEAHTALGTIIFFYEWNWYKAEEHFIKALQLNPNSSDSHFFYAHLLSNLGRHDEALIEVRRAIELDPLEIRFSALEGQFLFYAGKYGEAIDRLKKIQDLEPNFWLLHLFISRIYIEKGMFREAVEEATKARELSGGNTEAISFIGYALAKSGEKEKAREVIRELKKLSAETYVPPLNIALVYNALDETNETFEWLEKGFQAKDVRTVFLKVDPKWNNLRSNPRFLDLMRRMNFE